MDAVPCIHVSSLNVEPSDTGYKCIGLKNRGRKVASARQRIRADPSLPDIPKFGEHIYFKPAKTVKIPKDEAKWRTGIWLGFTNHTNEHIIGTQKGAFYVRNYDPIGVALLWPEGWVSRSLG